VEGRAARAQRAGDPRPPEVAPAKPRFAVIGPLVAAGL
jgi:hypothetical protein